MAPKQTKPSNRGGARPGAGRPKKQRVPTGTFPDAYSYLQAVVRGEVEPDPLRIAAGKAILAYELPKTRAKPSGPTPKALQHKQRVQAEAANIDNFMEKAAVIRARHAERGNQ